MVFEPGLLDARFSAIQIQLLRDKRYIRHNWAGNDWLMYCT